MAYQYLYLEDIPNQVNKLSSPNTVKVFTFEGVISEQNVGYVKVVVIGATGEKFGGGGFNDILCGAVVEGVFVVFRCFFVKVCFADFKVWVLTLVDVVQLGVERGFEFESGQVVGIVAVNIS